jgi:glutamine cyclotransferase
LEYIDGEIWANIWQTECIARICPDSGKVKGWVLMHGLRSNLAKRGLTNRGIDVLNGEHGQASDKGGGCRSLQLNSYRLPPPVFGGISE